MQENGQKISPEIRYSGFLKNSGNYASEMW